MKSPIITREAILDGSIRDYILRHPELRRLALPDAERAASLRATLGAAPAKGDVWVFGYGSLIWNPAFHFVEKRTARINGYHRRFCLWTQLGRGSAENPGLMLGLERGGACRGVVFRIAEKAVETELDILWRREMFTGAYCPTWVSAHSHGQSFAAIAFVINRENSRYAGRLPDDEIARHIATAVGPMGACCDYLFQTVEHLAALGLRDRRLEAIAGKVRARRQ
ncbi:MAG: gamma-glutamylcyclotransferase [Gammaproteobacteria bacterium]|nr:MAG: gamma-glutamylcyclotransferase [Gammaproteobacteria bacterium]